MGARPDTTKLRILLIADRRAALEGQWLRAVEAALAGGTRAVMLREKDLAVSALRDMATALREITLRAGALLIVNDRVDLAVEVGADGVHLGWRSMTVGEARSAVGPQRLIGVSTHSVEEALRAESEGADYVTFGPVFPTPSKEGLVEVQGLAGVRRLRAAGLGIPLLGLGGIDSENAASVFAAGADGVAMIRGLMAAADPEAVARRMMTE